MNKKKFLKTESHVYASSVDFPPNTGGSFSRHYMFVVFVVSHHDKNGVVATDLYTAVFLDVIGFHASQKLET